MKSIRLHTTSAFQLYANCLMEAEAYDLELSLTIPATLAVAIALACPDDTRGAPNG